MQDLLPLFVIIPLAAAFIAPIVSRRFKWVPDLLGNAVMAVLAPMSMLTIGLNVTCNVGGWAQPLGIELRVDGLATLMLITVNVIGLAMTMFSVQYMTRYTSKLRYYSLLMGLVAAMNGVVLSGDVFNMFIFMEIAAVCSYALVGFGTEHEELEAAFKYAVLGTIASAFILIGIGLTYGMVGSLNMTRIAQGIGSINKAGGSSLPLSLALGLFLCGFGLKAALVPFHAWLPDAHPSAPAPVSAMLSGVVIKTMGVYVLARFVFNIFGQTSELQQILRWLGVISMVGGVLLAIGQWDLKRLLAYHSISQIGYVVLGLGMGPLGMVGGLFHLVNHSVFKSLLFLNAGAVEYATGTRDLHRLGGLNGKMPVTANTSLIASLSISGIPPLNGFWSKLIIVIACVEQGHYWFALAAVLVSLITLSSFLKVQKYGFFEALKPALAGVSEVPVLMRMAMLLLAVLCVVLALAVTTGIRTPFLVDEAAQVLVDGRFGTSVGIALR